MSLLQRYWGHIPVSPQSRGIHLVRAYFNRVLHSVARYSPLVPAWRVSLHRARGVAIGKHVFIGVEVFIDDATPTAITIEDDVTIIAQTSIIGHTYYPPHFYPVLGDETGRENARTTIRRGAYLGLRSTILSGVTVGDYAIVAAGSVVTKDVPPYTIVAGVPARVVRSFGAEDLRAES